MALSLQKLEADWGFIAARPMLRLRFFLRFLRELHPRTCTRRAIARDWIRREEAEWARFHRARYRELMEEDLKSVQAVAGAWRGNTPIAPEDLLRIVETLRSQRSQILNISPRAEVWRDSLMGEDVVIKYFPANPRAWRQWLGRTRARRGWAGNMILYEAGLPCPEPLGFAERRIQGHPGESVMIMRMVPDARSLRRHLVHRLPAMSEKKRVNLRHELREIHLGLHRHGIYHKDIKALNLLVRECREGLRWWWIDLEDIRVSPHPPVHEVIRNFYQLNSSIPKRVRLEERLAFVAGYRHRHPLATCPWVLRHVEQKTRARLRLVTHSRSDSQAPQKS